MKKLECPDSQLCFSFVLIYPRGLRGVFLWQVMYMYYLLGFRLTRQCQQQILEALQSGKASNKFAWAVNRDEAMGSVIFEMLDDSISEKVRGQGVRVCLCMCVCVCVCARARVLR